ncbi:MAG: N-acetylmuramoyl-L-alanine amidase [Chitinispirillaceae bacterium]|nr:N-acetylmuramoyl-L-alanine amidase [Chitinispirillaceae bacterium]
MRINVYDLLLKKCNFNGFGKIEVGNSEVETNKEFLWSERTNKNVDVIVIHYMSAIEISKKHLYKIENIIKIFWNYSVSAHYIISRRGKIYRLVPEEFKAWHCGGSIMPEPDNRTGVNDFSIGIELMATESSGFTISQYNSLVKLCSSIEKRWGKKMTYVGHDQIAGERAVSLGLRNDIKSDPGPLFDWVKFFEKLEAARDEFITC